MVGASAQDRRLPLVPTLLCLYGAGWAGSLATSLLLVGGAAPRGAGSPIITVLIARLGSAAVAAVVVRQLLGNMLGCEITYGSALLALAGGALTSTAAWILLARSQGGQLVAPAGSFDLSILPSLLGTFVSYLLLQYGASLGPLNRLEPDQEARRPSVSTTTAAPQVRPESYDDCVSAAREATLGLTDAIARAEPADVPGLILNGLPTLETVAQRVEQARRPAKVPAELHQRLVAGIRALQQDLVETSTEAATATGHQTDERSLLLPSTGDLSDSGPRYRWQLSDSHGLRATRQALSDLYNLDIGTGW